MSTYCNMGWHYLRFTSEALVYLHQSQKTTSPDARTAASWRRCSAYREVSLVCVPHQYAFQRPHPNSEAGMVDDSDFCKLVCYRHGQSFVFCLLPFYLASRGADVGDNSNYTTWRDYAINQVAGLFGPIIATVLVETKLIGWRGTVAIGALITMLLQFGYTQITTPAQNLGVSAAISAAS